MSSGVWVRAAAAGLVATLAGGPLDAVVRQVGPATYPIAVDFLAVDSDGRPVRDLAPGDVSIRLGRETANVRALRFIPAAGDGGRATLRAPQPFGSPEAFDFQRSFLVAVDDESLPQGAVQSVRDAISLFIRQLRPDDRVGLATVPHGSLRVALTTEHSRVVQSAQQVSGRAPARESPADAACRARNVLGQVAQLIRDVGRPNAPLTIVFFSASMYDGGGAVQAPLGSFIGCDLQLSEFRQLSLRAAESRSYLYIVQPEVFTDPAWVSSPRSGLEHMAGATGGRIMEIGGRGSDMFRRIASEVSGVYLAGALVRSKPRGGTLYDVSVRTTRPGVTILARPHLAVPPDPESIR